MAKFKNSIDPPIIIRPDSGLSGAIDMAAIEMSHPYYVAEQVRGRIEALDIDVTIEAVESETGSILFHTNCESDEKELEVQKALQSLFS